jgi:peptidoglycan/LPS O-acetylase OafA/YrhL
MLPSLTGLRAIAAGLVFFRHTQYLFNGNLLQDSTLRLFVQGGVGVSFFYILSGFVLTWSWRGGSRAFFRRRFARIYPAYATTWIIGGGIALYVGRPTNLGIALTNLFLVQAWIPSNDYFTGMNGVSWSLSCEAFFYALFPLLVVVCLRLGSWQRASALAVLLLAIVAVPTTTSLPPLKELWITYIFPPTRLLEFVCGILVALIVRAGRWPRIPVSAVIAFAVAAYLLAGEAGRWQPANFTTYDAFVAVTVLPFILLIGTYAQRDVEAQRSLLRSTWAVRLGEWSYSFYLVHFLVIELFQHWTLTWSPSPLAACAVTLLLLAVSTALAAALYHLVERPLERLLRGSLRAPAAELDARVAAHA